MRLWNVVAACSTVLLVLSCGSQDPGFGPYPSMLGVAGSGVASFNNSEPGAQDSAAMAAIMTGMGCPPVGPNQIGIVVFNFDNITNEYSSTGETGPGPVSHTMLISQSGRSPASLGSLTVPACESRCMVLPCTRGDVINIKDEQESAAGPSDDTSFQGAYTKFQMCGIPNGCSIELDCGQIAVVLIERLPSGIAAQQPWSIRYRNGGNGVKQRPVTGCPTDMAMQLMAVLPYVGLAD